MGILVGEQCIWGEYEGSFEEKVKVSPINQLLYPSAIKRQSLV